MTTVAEFLLRQRRRFVVKIVRVLISASVIYVFCRVLLWGGLLFDRGTSDMVNYHYASTAIWYCLWFVLPIVLSLIIGYNLHSLFICKAGTVLLPLVIVITIVGGNINHHYWGYSFRHPAVFSEVQNATHLFSIADIEKSSGQQAFSLVPGTATGQLFYACDDWYYANLDRSLSALRERGVVVPPHAAARSSAFVITARELQRVGQIIMGSGFLLTPAKGYEKRGKSYEGKILAFMTDTKVYCYVYITSGEIENDHYPFYEFLLDISGNYSIVKKQRYFTDVAGFERLEYCNLAPIVEFLALLGSIGVGLLWSAWQKQTWYSTQKSV